MGATGTPSAGPGRVVFKLPDIGEGIAAAEVTAWHVAVGDLVAEESPLVDVMTDKATVEISAPFTGRVVALNAKVGDAVPVGAELVVFAVEGAGAPAGAPPQERPAEAPPAPAQAASGPPGAASAVAAGPAAEGSRAASPSAVASLSRKAPPPAGASPARRPLASPAVRRRAYGAGVPLQFVAGSGPEGRITQADLDQHLAGAPTARPAAAPARDVVEEVPVVGLRRRIAERMQDAKRRIPHFSYVEEVDVTALEELRAALNARHGESRPRLTVLPFLVRALVKALPDFPGLNARYDDEAGIVRRHGAVHVGIAAQTPAGLVVPVLRHAEGMDLWGCAAEIARLSAAAREGRSSRAELTGSTITLTSLGPLGGLATTPVINAPEVAIVGVNKIALRPVYRDGALVPRKMMNLSSSFDHRVVDGWHAAEFVQRLRALLEQPATLFLD